MCHTPTLHRILEVSFSAVLVEAFPGEQRQPLDVALSSLSAAPHARYGLV